MLAGVYFLYIDNQTINGLAAPATSPFTVSVGTEGLQSANLETFSYSGSGQLEYDLTNTVTATGGLCIIREQKNYLLDKGVFINVDDTKESGGVDDSGIFQPTNLLFKPGRFGTAPFTDEIRETMIAGMFRLDWRPTDNVLLYAGVHRGVKAGSFNAKLQDGTPNLELNQIPYKEGVLSSIEWGFKSTIFDGTTRVNGSFYYYDYRDYPAFTFSGVAGTVSNADAETFGAELEILSNPFAGVDFMLGIGAFDVEVEDIEVAPGIFEDVDPSFAPELTLSGLARYQ